MMKLAPITFKGIPASYGKFYGKVLKIISSNHIILETKISNSELNLERDKFLNALKKTKIELENIIGKKTLNSELGEILTSQIVMLDDPILIEGVLERIKTKNENSALALFHTIESISLQFESLDDEYLRERGVDIRDIGKRIEENLLGKKNDFHILSHIAEEVILIAHEITPSQMIHLDKKHIKGIATEMGGKTGHMAILAKNYSIPTIVGLNGITNEIEQDEFIFIDADEGIVIKNPTINIIKHYGSSSQIKNLQQKKINPITKDGVRIQIKVNLDSELDCDAAMEVGFDGVGLYRSEAMLIEDFSKISDEEHQFSVYKEILSKMKDLPVTIRIFDIGGDKFHSKDIEDNPFLGNRGIRYALINKSWFKKQIRALLRASVYGNLSIMLPMILNLHEVRDTKKLIEECEQELKSKSIPFKSVPLGIMIETPGCALASDSFAKEVDFFSIGTNDLLQYVTAVDRNNPYISNLYNPYHIGFLRLIQNIANVSIEKNIPLSICGELASDTNFTILLLGFGLKELSVSLPLALKISKIISSIEIAQASKLLKQILELSEAEKYSEIEAFLFNKHLGWRNS
jgi:phosphoenolpyruvate-protein phosphotransferase (PTS system enzyme I)